MGPIVTAAAHEKITGYIAQGEKEGAKLVVDGRKFQGSDAGKGCEQGFLDGRHAVRSTSSPTCASTARRSSALCCLACA